MTAAFDVTLVYFLSRRMLSVLLAMQKIKVSQRTARPPSLYVLDIAILIYNYISRHCGSDETIIEHIASFWVCIIGRCSV